MDKHWLCDSFFVHLKAVTECIHLCMRNLVGPSLVEEVDKLEASIATSYPSALVYLNRAWLPYAHIWVNCSFKWHKTIGIYTTKRWKQKFVAWSWVSMRSDSPEIFSVILHSHEELADSSFTRTGRALIGAYVPLSRMDIYSGCPRNIRNIAWCAFERHFIAHLLTSLQKSGSH